MREPKPIEIYDNFLKLSAAKLADRFVPIGEINDSLAEFSQPLFLSQGESPIVRFRRGCAFLTEYRGKFLLLCSAHQLDEPLNNAGRYREEICLYSRLKNSLVSANGIWVDFVHSVDEKTDETDFVCFDFTNAVRDGYFPATSFFPLRNRSIWRGVDCDSNWVYSLSYPFDSVEATLSVDSLSYEEMTLEMRFDQFMVDCNGQVGQLVKLFPLVGQKVLSDGSSGSPVFGLRKGVDAVEVVFAGIVLRGCYFLPARILLDWLKLAIPWHRG